MSDTIQAVVTVIMFQSFAVDKSVHDVIIYASLSKKVKSDLKVSSVVARLND